MGSDRKWIYLSYIVATLVTAWVLNNVLLLVVHAFKLPNPMVMGVVHATTVVSVVAMAISGYLYFRQEKVQTFSFEVLQELKKVTWPPRKNAYLSTVVVVVTVMIAAAILGGFDWLCASLLRIII